MASPAMAQPSAGAPTGTTGQGQAPGQPQAQEAIADFRALAQMVQGLAKKYPEATQLAAAMLPEIQKTMARVASNPGRTPDQKAPPVAA